MKTALTIIILLFQFISINAQTYKKILIKLNSRDDIELLNKSGIDLEGAISLKEMTAKLYVSEAELLKVNNLGLSYSILIDDWNKYYNSLRTLTQPEINQLLDQSKNQYGVTGFGYGSMGGFYTYDEVNAQLDSMHARYPNLITQKQSIGTTAGGRPIYMVKITNSSITQAKPQVSYNAMHHAREPMGMECLIYFMYYLLENYNTNSSIKYLVDNRELYFVPICNPDGYEYNRSTNPSGGGFWRKNRKDNGDGTFGVDINRNYGPTAYWNAPNGGSSTVTSDETYRGTAPFSENETVAIKNYYAAHKFKNSVSYHTFGNDMVYPYGALIHETADSLYFRELARDITGYNGYIYGTDMQTVGYSTRGNSDDYFYDGDTAADGGKIFAMTPEVGTDFWPPQSEIIPDVQINILPNLYWAWFAGDFATLKNINIDRLYFKAGDTASIKPVIRNKGLATVRNLTFEATSLSSYCTFINNSQSLDSISSRSDRTVSNPMKFVISSTAPSAQKVNITFTTKISGIIVAVDTINFTIGIPTFIFADTTNNPVTLWTIAGTPSGSPKWDTTKSDYHSAPNCYTDSKAGNYATNATITMTSTNAINLSGYSNPKLSFWTKWEIETLYDCGVLQISTDNGSTWNALKGTLTKPASGNGRQVPAGIPIFDGTHYYWTRETIDLSAYAGQQIKLRFALWSDGGTERDGWYVDDISIYYYGALPVELTSFTAKAESNNVTLKWKTATELNDLGFEVQRSKELNSFIGGWQTIGFVRGRGTSITSSGYSFTDRNPLPGKQYYRIKQVDANGTFTIYGPVEADNFANISFSLEQNYPNPFNPNTVIKYTIPTTGTVTIKLYDVLGSEMATLINEYKEAGMYSLNFSLSELKNKMSSGVYFYTIKAGQFTQTRKMVIMK
jgi:carboxypeptidase T